MIIVIVAFVEIKYSPQPLMGKAEFIYECAMKIGN